MTVNIPRTFVFSDGQKSTMTNFETQFAAIVEAINNADQGNLIWAVVKAIRLNLNNYTVSTLPSGTRGDICYVTDATGPTYLGVLTGGGAVITPVFYNGSAWVSF